MKLTESNIPELRYPVALSGSNMANMESSTLAVSVGIGIAVGVGVGIALAGEAPGGPGE